MDRRSLFRAAGLMAALPAFARRALGATATRDPLDVYKRLGLRPIINAAGTYTHLGGSLMPPEVIAAMDDAAQMRRGHGTGERECGNEGRECDTDVRHLGCPLLVYLAALATFTAPFMPAS